MEFSLSAQSRLFSIVDTVYQHPSFSELCQFLATTVCPSGELARVYVGQLDIDGVIRTAGSFGYPVDTELLAEEVPLEAHKPMSVALRNRVTIVANKEQILKDFPEFKPLDVRGPWLSTAVSPTLASHVYMFGLQYKIDKPKFAETYFGIVGRLLSFYDVAKGIRAERATPATFEGVITKSNKDYEGIPLTERQELILRFIKEKKTNTQIADLLGYSESLIRQETVIIYKKLKVSGRAEILK
jgi:DNA-binding CsgD family transcriptional regulator